MQPLRCGAASMAGHGLSVRGRCSAPRPSVLPRRAARALTAAPRALLTGGEADAVAAAASSAAAAKAAAAPSLLAPFLMAHLPALADIDPAAAADAAATATAAAASTDNGGAFGWLADGFEAVLEVLESGLEAANVPYAYGFAIILLTIMVKAATYPLSRKSMESTASMQALQPRVKELQARYANDPETLQLETARLYRDAGVNPLAGCLPTLATIPVFIGLYRALTKAADDGLLQSGFFWIPSLAGPTTLASRQAGAGLSWLFPLQDGAPPIGWHDAAAYLVLPVLLVISQFVSQKIISPPSDDPAAKQSQNILRFIPLMIGWFSLNVPSGLTLYWFVNNVISTAQQVYMKRSLKASPVVAAANAAATGSAARAELRPKEERAGPSGRELGARKKRREGGGDVIDVEASAAAPAASTSGSSSAPSSSGSGGNSGNQRGNKFRARKAREAAARAAALSSKGGSSNGNGNGNGGAPAAAAPAATAEPVTVPESPPSPPPSA